MWSNCKLCLLRMFSLLARKNPNRHLTQYWSEFRSKLARSIAHERMITSTNLYIAVSDGVCVFVDTARAHWLPAGNYSLEIMQVCI
jgi:hypothetical protein